MKEFIMPRMDETVIPNNEGCEGNLKLHVTCYVNRSMCYVSCSKIVLNQFRKLFPSNHKKNINYATHCTVIYKEKPCD